ncbi:glycosyltransferase family 2 protein [Methylobacterium sp. P31]
MKRRCSAIVCVHTRDRWDTICEAIRSLERQILPCDEIIIVVDHNVSLLRDLAARFPAAILLENSQKKGLSGARNTGVEAATSDIIAFLDDDAVAEPSWLLTALRWFDDPSVLGVASLIEPNWLAPTPRWFPDEFLWTVGCTYRGYATSGNEIRNVLGAAMIVRRDVLRQAGGFSHAVGRHGGALPISCEETEPLHAREESQPKRPVYLR